MGTLSLQDHRFDSVVADAVNTVIDLKVQVYLCLEKGKGPFVLHREAEASLFAIKLSIHHSIAWQLEVFLLENWSIELRMSRHLDHLHQEDPEWDLVDDLRTTKRLFIWLILIFI